MIRYTLGKAVTQKRDAWAELAKEII